MMISSKGTLNAPSTKTANAVEIERVNRKEWAEELRRSGNIINNNNNPPSHFRM